RRTAQTAPFPPTSARFRALPVRWRALLCGFAPRSMQNGAVGSCGPPPETWPPGPLAFFCATSAVVVCTYGRKVRGPPVALLLLEVALSFWQPAAEDSTSGKVPNSARRAFKE